MNVISSVVHANMENFSVYTSMKNALHGFTGCRIKEARQVGIKVTGVYPGGVDTTFRAQNRTLFANVFQALTPGVCILLNNPGAREVQRVIVENLLRVVAHDRDLLRAVMADVNDGERQAWEHQGLHRVIPIISV